MLVFPELIFLHEIQDRKIQYKLDWNKKDSYVMNEKMSWYEKYSDLSDEELYELREYFKTEADWDTYFFPPKLQQTLDDYSEIIIDTNYFEEMEHFKQLAISEWNRKRGFDTSVREGCLTVAQEAVNRYFYLLHDCFLVNSEVNDREMHYDTNRDTKFEYEIIQSLWMFKLWKNQTGGGLVSGKALEGFKHHSRDILDYLEPIYKENMGFDIVPSDNWDGHQNENVKEFISRRIQKRERTETLKTLIDEA